MPKWFNASARNSMLRVVLHPAAEKELESAAFYYEVCCEGLGDAFLNDYESTLALIVSDPEQLSRYFKDNRKKNLKRFPFGIVYSQDGDVLYVKAIMHLHRRPHYWKFR